MKPDALFRLDGDAAAFAIGSDANGAARGFLDSVVVLAGRALSLSSMPRHRETPNGLNEWLLADAIGWEAAHGFGRVSMNVSRFPEPLAPAVEQQRLSGSRRLQRQALARLKGHGFQLENLLALKRTFFPRPKRRHAVDAHRPGLLRIVLAGPGGEGCPPAVGRRR